MFIEEWLLEKLLREERERSQGYLYMPYVSVPFRRVESERFHMSAQELKAYEMPITKIIEDNSVKAMQQEQDDHLLEALGYAYDKLWGNK